MTFEEFFKKKRIDLVALQKGDTALFSEFKTHFEQMGEKSFDHTKKYWFNKLRHVYLLPAEIKTEKVKIDNPLAEQTITESLLEQAALPPKLGFTPKFRAGATNPAAPAEDAVKAEDVPKENKADTTGGPAIAPTPKPGFTPRFKAGMTKPAAPVEDAAKPAEPSAENKTDAVAEPATTPAPKPGFTPRFKPGITKPAAPFEDTAKPEEKPVENIIAPETEPQPALKPKPGFTPRFKAANPPKPIVENTEQADTTIAAQDKQATPPPEADEAPKAIYKPRFNMKNIPPKKEEE